MTAVAARVSDSVLEELLAPHRAWVEGRAALETLERDQIVRARRVFEGVLEHTADHAPAHIGLANACVMQFEMTRADERPDVAALEAADAAFTRSLSPDPDYGEAWATLGFVLDRTGAPSTRSRRRGARSRSSQTTGGIISGWRTSVGAKSVCERRIARWPCCQAFRWRIG